MTKLKDALLEDIEQLKEIVNELNSWDGCLDDLSCHENDEDFFNTFFENNPSGAVRATHYGEYNYSDDYVRFNGYGNLESFNEWKYEQLLKDSIDEIIEALLENKNNIDLDSEIEEILGEMEEE